MNWRTLFVVRNFENFHEIFEICGKVVVTFDHIVVVWGRYLGVAGANGEEAGGSSCGVPETGDKVERKKA